MRSGTHNECTSWWEFVLVRLQCIHGECVECVQEPAQQEATIGPVSKDYKYASAEAVERWHDMKFGLRIHWGLYSIQGAHPQP